MDHLCDFVLTRPAGMTSLFKSSSLVTMVLLYRTTENVLCASIDDTKSNVYVLIKRIELGDHWLLIRVQFDILYSGNR